MAGMAVYGRHCCPAAAAAAGRSERLGSGGGGSGELAFRKQQPTAPGTVELQKEGGVIVLQAARGSQQKVSGSGRRLATAETMQNCVNRALPGMQLVCD